MSLAEKGKLRNRFSFINGKAIRSNSASATIDYRTVITETFF